MKLESIDAQKILDVRGLTWPLPVVKALRALSAAREGDVLEFWALSTDFENELALQMDPRRCTVLGSLGAPDGYQRIFIKKLGREPFSRHNEKSMGKNEC